jgi:hypothetical protein
LGGLTDDHTEAVPAYAGDCLFSYPSLGLVHATLNDTKPPLVSEGDSSLRYSILVEIILHS